MRQHGLELRFGLHPFGDDREIEIAAQPGHIGQQAKRARIAGNVGNKGPVDLELGEGQGAEIAQRRVARAKIVQRHPDPAGTEF
ncbi:hypothetical protein D3C72_2216150 [compost metagenome]